MRSREIDQFLDTGWYTDGTIYLNGFIYWCEATKEFETGVITFTVNRWRADCDGEFYYQYVSSDGLVDFSCVFELKDTDLDQIKQQFLRASIFDGRTFWEIRNEAIWAEPGEDYMA